MLQNLSQLYAAWHPQKNNHKNLLVWHNRRQTSLGFVLLLHLKILTETYLLTSLHLLDGYNNHNYSCCVYILSCCHQPESDKITEKKKILGWEKESDLPVSRFDNADRKTMKSLRANPECQLLNATSVSSCIKLSYFSVVSLFNIVSLFCLSLYGEITPGFAQGLI